jgi:hypothetical protein
MVTEIETEVGDNWSVFFFEVSCATFKTVLFGLFQYLREIEAAHMPHFMIRECTFTQHLGISLRVLRDHDNMKIVDDRLAEFFERKKLPYDRDPKGNRHAWLEKRTRNEKWNKERCEILHQLSKLAVSLAKDDIFGASDRCHIAHYLVNMLGLQEATLLGTDRSVS